MHAGEIFLICSLVCLLACFIPQKGEGWQKEKEAKAQQQQKQQQHQP